MKRTKNDQMMNNLNLHLVDGEEIISIGIFKKMPSTSWLLLTKGLAWILTQEFYVAVTNQRLIILPGATHRRRLQSFEDPIFADFNKVRLYEGPLKNTMLDVHKMYKGSPLNLRFKTECLPEGIDLYDFISALRQRTASSSENL
jgi:hypothetical protein